MIEFFIALILFTPVVGMLIFQIYNPKDARLLGHRWQYDKEPEFTPDALKLYQILAGIGLGAIVLFFLIWLVSLTG